MVSLGITWNPKPNTISFNRSSSSNHRPRARTPTWRRGQHWRRLTWRSRWTGPTGASWATGRRITDPVGRSWSRPVAGRCSSKCRGGGSGWSAGTGGIAQRRGRSCSWRANTGTGSFCVWKFANYLEEIEGFEINDISLDSLFYRESNDTKHDYFICDMIMKQATEKEFQNLTKIYLFARLVVKIYKINIKFNLLSFNSAYFVESNDTKSICLYCNKSKKKTSKNILPKF